MYVLKLGVSGSNPTHTSNLRINHEQRIIISRKKIRNTVEIFENDWSGQYLDTQLWIGSPKNRIINKFQAIIYKKIAVYIRASNAK
jgi:hypothetical protein